ncbi:MAG: 1-pyrroline-5 carboxylate dehydrogenase [uncultured bacterium]|nr:MAG: 1-pyrroline-5 carboxylate dehydrogenase [uncultured bacterium]
MTSAATKTNPIDDNMNLEHQIKNIGRTIFEQSQAASKIFKKNFFADLLMDWAMKRQDIKVEMFRFVDVLPTLMTRSQIVDHMREYFLADDKDFPLAIQAGLKVALSNPITSTVTASTVTQNVKAMASVFITGENSERARKKLEDLWNDNYCFTVDILGEAVVSEPEAREYQGRYLELVKGLAEHVKPWKPNPILEQTSLGKIPRANVSVKLSSLFSQIDPLAFESSVKGIKEALRPILRSAMQNNVFINLDMEQNDFRDVTLTVIEELFTEPEFADYPHFGLVIQAYLKGAVQDLSRIITLSSGRKTPLTVRLVKGAYWDYEVILARQRNWPIPVFLKKPESDVNYETCTRLLLDSYPKVLSAFASHNIRSVSHAMAYAAHLGLNKTDFEIQTLYGMGNNFKKPIVNMGYRVREYSPIGEMLPGMAYLVRRLLENTSNEGFLKQSNVDLKDVDELLRNPEELVDRES